MASNKPASSYTNKESLEAIKRVLVQMRDINWKHGTDLVEKLLLEEDGYDTEPKDEDGGFTQNLQKEVRSLKKQLEEKTKICQNFEWMLNENESFDNKSTGKTEQKLQEENQRLKAEMKNCETVMQRYRLEREKQAKPHEEVMSKQMHTIEILTNENEDLKTTIKSKEHDTNDILKKVDSLNKKVKKLKNEKDTNETKLKNMEEENHRLQTELKETRTRLSKIMSAQMTDNNPDIADLSDQNRPDKLAEKYKELYDNQWSDAYEALEKIHPSYSDKQKVVFLQYILKEAKKFCEDVALAQTENLKRALFTGQTDNSLPDVIKKQLKELKKAMIPINKEVICQRFLASLPDYVRSNVEMRQYLEECVHVCWIMTMSDPPIVFGPELRQNDLIEYALYSSYTTKGLRVNYEVWPPMFVNEGGALLTKGVVEAIGDSDGRTAKEETRPKSNYSKNTSATRPNTAASGKRINFLDGHGNPINNILDAKSSPDYRSKTSSIYAERSRNELSSDRMTSDRNYEQLRPKTTYSSKSYYGHLSGHHHYGHHY